MARNEIYTFGEMSELCEQVKAKHGEAVLKANLSPFTRGKGCEFRHVRVGDFPALRKALLAELEFTVPKVHQAAIYQDGVVYTLSRPARHHDIIRHMVEAEGVEPPVTGEQGFVLSDGSFVDREAALQVALLANQLHKPRHHISQLFSEDLW